MRLSLLLLLLPLLAYGVSAWRPFSADSPWNQRIAPDAALDRKSADLIDDLASRGPWLVNIKDWPIPVYFVDADATAKHDVGDSRPGIHGRGFEFPRHIPIPDRAVASPPVGDHSDYHLSLIDRKKGLEWGMWAARKDAAGRQTAVARQVEPALRRANLHSVQYPPGKTGAYMRSRDPWEPRPCDRPEWSTRSTRSQRGQL